jgi:hypothetical protein
MSWLDSVFGSKPQIAAPRKVTPVATQAEAIDANIKNLGKITEQGDLYSQYLQKSLADQLGPEYADTLKAGSQAALATQQEALPLIRGEIPQDVQDQIMRSGAYQNLMGGGGQSFLRSLQARDLGLTSLDLMRQGAGLSAQGANTAAQWSNLASNTIYNPARDFITPAQAAALSQWNEQRRQAYQQTRFNVAAAPSPIAKGVSDTLIGLISAYLSKGGGGGGATQPANPYSTSVIGQSGGENVYSSYALPWDSGGGGGGGGGWSGFGQVGSQPLIYAQPSDSSYLGDINYGYPGSAYG